MDRVVVVRITLETGVSREGSEVKVLVALGTSPRRLVKVVLDAAGLAATVLWVVRLVTTLESAEAPLVPVAGACFTEAYVLPCVYVALDMLTRRVAVVGADVKRVADEETTGPPAVSWRRAWTPRKNAWILVVATALEGDETNAWLRVRIEPPDGPLAPPCITGASRPGPRAAARMA
mmetsp:Transcript_28069/g.72596  ORF Transcript_28069/g.72596 Transcript_28069/m.72596 type:complete len:177 (+) Transcript_28069:868-1398(+)